MGLQKTHALRGDAGEPARSTVAKELLVVVTTQVRSPSQCGLGYNHAPKMSAGKFLANRPIFGISLGRGEGWTFDYDSVSATWILKMPFAAFAMKARSIVSLSAPKVFTSLRIFAHVIPSNPAGQSARIIHYTGGDSRVCTALLKPLVSIALRAPVGGKLSQSA